MAEEKNGDSTKGADASAEIEKTEEQLAAELAAMPEEMSPEDIDKLLAEEDPDFLDSLGSIASDKNLSLSDATLSEEDNAKAEERQRWQNSKGLRKIIFTVAPFAPWLSYYLKKFIFRLKASIRAVWVHIKNFAYFLATDGKAKTYDALKKTITRRLEAFSKSRRDFTYLPGKIKAMFFAVAMSSLGLVVFVYFSYTRGVIPKDQKLFLTSFQDVADAVYEFDTVAEVEPFYDNLRASSNLILLPKMVVNILRSKGSGENPMAAFEFFVEGMVPEVVVEIKDRETEVRDAMHRVLEEFTYDELESADGKQAMQDKLIRRLNQILSTGKARKVFIKTVVIKP